MSANPGSPRRPNDETESPPPAAHDGRGIASAAVLPEVYEALRRTAARLLRAKPADFTPRPTDLVHSAWLKLTESGSLWESREHFCAVASRAVRQVLIDHARERKAVKRGGGRARISIDTLDEAALCNEVDLLRFDELLEELELTDPRRARVVEMKFFASMTHEQIARVLKVSVTTVERDLRTAKAWLTKELRGT